MWIDNSKGILGFDSLAILFDVLMDKEHETYGCDAVDDRGILKKNCPHDFVAAYANPWSSDYSRNWVSEQHSVGGVFYLQYHVRSTTTIDTPGDLSAATADGLLCERQSSILPQLGRDFRLVERRYSLSLRSYCKNYSIVVLEDPVVLEWNLPPLYAPYEEVYAGQKNRGFDHYNIHFTYEEWGIAHFQYLICRMTECWYYDWSTTLSQIDDMISIKVSGATTKSRKITINNLYYCEQIHDLADAECRRNLMYDDHNLQRSERYFSLLQLLRLFRDDIENSFQDLNHFRQEIHARDSWDPSPGKMEHPKVQRNWGVVLKFKEDRHDALLARIDGKTREIESLRNGVSYLT